jgi:DNA repair exonuclease SbcCD ATPase subunit
MESESEISTAVLIEPESIDQIVEMVKENEIITDEPITFQKLEEKATKAQEALEKEEKLRKDLEALNSKLLAEKTALLDSLSGEKGAIQDYQEKCAKLTAQKNDLDNQLRVSIKKINK